MARYIVGCFGVIWSKIFELSIDVLNVPWPDIISNHPWSMFFIYWWAVCKGIFIINWVDSGTRFHIIHEAKCVSDKFKLDDLFEDILVLIIHAVNNPMLIINSGVILIRDGSMYILLVSNIAHLMDLPAIIDIVPSSIIGMMIFICSLMWRNGLDRLGPHSTTKLNRTE